MLNRKIIAIASVVLVITTVTSLVYTNHVTKTSAKAYVAEFSNGNSRGEEMQSECPPDFVLVEDKVLPEEVRTPVAELFSTLISVTESCMKSTLKFFSNSSLHLRENMVLSF